MAFLIVSFIAGALTVLAPCILPLLPVVIGASAQGRSKFTPYIVVGSLALSIIIFTYLLKASTTLIMVPGEFWTYLSGGILVLFGITLLFPSLWEKLPGVTRLSVGSNQLVGSGYQKKSFWGDVIIGAALGPVFSTCSPTYFVILASVLPVSFLLGTIYMLAYVLGLSLVLLLIALLGQRFTDRLVKISDSRGLFKRIVGMLFIILGILIATGYEKKLETLILDSGYFDITKIEQKLLEINSDKKETNTQIQQSEENEGASLREGVENKNLYLNAEQKEEKFTKVPELSSIDGYINTNGAPVTLSGLKGKVVLLDVWTYSCINCQRTIPYLNEWYGKYKDQGLEIVGLHTPEFAFEKVSANVERAVENFNIKYPVVLDNDYSTWRALGNNFWPRKYLVDIDGYIVYDHIGEGAYEETEKEIQKALKERAERMSMDVKISETISKPANAIATDPSKVNSPEIYFGWGRNKFLGNGAANPTGEKIFSLPESISANKLYLEGAWRFDYEYAENKSEASIVFKYEAKNVYLVASAETDLEIEIYQDDKFVKKVNVKDEQLYQLIENSDYGTYILKIKIHRAGLKAFTFTFG